jgi:hypothetical protein
MRMQDAMPGALARSATFKDHYGGERQDGPFFGEAVIVIAAVRSSSDKLHVFVVDSDGCSNDQNCSFVQLNRMHVIRGMGSPPGKQTWSIPR